MSEHPSPAIPGANCQQIGGVYVWQAALDVPAARFEVLRAHLAPDEIARANRYRFAAPRQHFIVARGLLREILGVYLEVSPAQLQFRQNAWGKPTLARPHDRLHFNVAHSGGLALYAVAMYRAVGIDVERIRPVAHLERLAARFFSPNECRAFLALPREQWLAAFFTTWTRKEAYMKARGVGFSLPPKAFDVPISPRDPPQILADRHCPGEGCGWSMHNIPAGPGYKASLVVQVLATRHFFSSRINTD